MVMSEMKDCHPPMKKSPQLCHVILNRCSCKNEPEFCRESLECLGDLALFILDFVPFVTVFLVSLRREDFGSRAYYSIA